MATTLLQGAQIVNQALTELGYTYQIDTTSNDTITDGLNAIGAYAPTQRNAIMEQMNLILQQRNFGVMFNAEKNKFRAFLVDMMTYGFGIEDVFHELIDGRQPLWDGNATAQQIAEDLVSYDENKIAKTFHTKPMEKQFKATVDRRNYDKVFTAYGVTRFIDTKLANLSWSAEYWLMQQAIDVIRDMVANNDIVFNRGNGLNNKNDIDGTVEVIKTLVDGFKTPSNQFNKGVASYNTTTNTVDYTPVINMTDNEDYIFIVTTPEYLNRLKVYGYSNAFNLSQYELDGRILFAPAGSSLGTDPVSGDPVAFVVFDMRSVLLGLRHWLGSSFFVPNTHVSNHWLTVEGIKGYNTFFNAVAVVCDPIDAVVAGEAKTATLNVVIGGTQSFNYEDIIADGEGTVGQWIVSNYDDYDHLYGNSTVATLKRKVTTVKIPNNSANNCKLIVDGVTVGSGSGEEQNYSGVEVSASNSIYFSCHQN